MRNYNLAIIGGSASGMMAAVSALKVGSADGILLLEKNQILGKKILATGNGRCNFSNINCRWQDYYGSSFVRRIFDNLDPAKTVEVFYELGVLAKKDIEGRLYPYSEQATSISAALEDKIRSEGIEIRLNAEVNKIIKKNNLFHITLKDESITASRVIIATGGKAGIKHGSTGDGYGFAKSFGHTLKRPLPALVQIVTDDIYAQKLKGTRAEGKASLLKGKDVIAEEKGEIQFTKDGLSGICVFDLSRYLDENPENFHIRIDLFPDYNHEEMLNMLIKRKQNMPKRPAEALIKGLLNERLISTYLDSAGIPASLSCNEIEDRKLAKLAKLFKGRDVGIKATKGWIEAQVTKGGINVEEIKDESLESKIVPGLFFAGEILDVDGRCGGWNLQWAWSSGWTAGLNAGK